MNPFEKHGIDHLSASSLNLFQDEPAVWSLRYLFKAKDDVGPAAFRGSAVEAGLDVMLYSGDYEKACDTALGTFDAKIKEQNDASDKQRTFIPEMLDQAIDAMKDRPEPVTHQKRIEVRLDGIEVPVVGYIDYQWEDCLIDLKTTLRMPSSIDTVSAAHKRQIAIYRLATGQRGSLLYVTPKKSSVIEVHDAAYEDAMSDIYRIARSLRNTLLRSRDSEEVAELQAPNYGSFYWSDSLIAHAGTVPAWQ